MNDPYVELMELVRWERKPSLTPELRVKEFQESLQRAKNGDEVSLRGFVILRKPPWAPKDAAYYLFSPLSPGELRELKENVPRPYVVLRIDEGTVINGRLSSGSYVEVKGVLDSFPWGTLRMIRVLGMSAVDYSDYWKDYSWMALSRREVEELIESTIYAGRNFQLGLTYALYGSPRLLESPRSWGEGSEFSVLGYEGREAGILSLWHILRFIHSLLPWELQFRKERRTSYVDPFLDIDFTLFNPNGSGVSYYTPRSPGKVSNYARKFLLSKSITALLPLPRKARPRDELAGKAEIPFVFIPSEDERPYLEKNSEFMRLFPNLLATIFMERERVGVVSASDSLGQRFRRKFEDWIIDKRNEYGWRFDVLTVPGGVLDVGTRYELSFRLLGSMGRLEGAIRKSLIRNVENINDEIVNDWMTIVSSMPQSELDKLIKEYHEYIPSDRRAARALEVFRDIASTSLTGDVGRDEFRDALVRAGFGGGSTEKIIESLIREGYIYEPLAGKLRLVR
ncbi:hypothetical protein [Thermococcus sp. Bubb.Bath]|uniref:hypothetical protein n=1 Tax=Thermococcus sp. Bubb.Bath TaxID=1638242 RepID=UPI00143A59A2|nr:hypothetical protein [Thermococcus sp. Bubb.Bath]NJF24903.1 hypothetical protein [Thermococcus sp. Bubb.Bath]